MKRRSFFESAAAIIGLAVIPKSLPENPKCVTDGLKWIEDVDITHNATVSARGLALEEFFLEQDRKFLRELYSRLKNNTPHASL